MAYSCIFATVFGGSAGFAEASHPMCAYLFGAGGFLLLIGLAILIRPDLLRH